MLPKLIILVLLFAIVVSLFSGLYFMFKDNSQTKRMVNALTVRVALSIALIAFLIIGYLMGWIHPHGVGQ